MSISLDDERGKEGALSTFEPFAAQAAALASLRPMPRKV